MAPLVTVSAWSQFEFVLGMTLNCINIFIVTGSFLYWFVMSLCSQCFFICSCIYLWILIMSYFATFIGTNSLSVLMCRKAVNQSICMLLHWKHSSSTVYSWNLVCLVLNLETGVYQMKLSLFAARTIQRCMLNVYTTSVEINLLF